MKEEFKKTEITKLSMEERQQLIDGIKKQGQEFFLDLVAAKDEQVNIKFCPVSDEYMKAIGLEFIKENTP